MTLRSKELLTVNIYDSTFSGEAMVLTGAAEPFETQEEGGDDIFTPVRLQSGYLRIVDNGFAADGVTAFNWRDFIPTTDTDRPVTLTDANDNVLWQGFMQAQNFGATLFGNPQTREFPIQCGLSVTQGVDINFSQKEIKNFAYLIKQIVDAIPSTCRPTHIMVQGDAFICLPKTIDWQLFVDEDEDNTAIAKYKVYECLEEMCKFWGWTARTAGQTLYLLCPDDASVPYTFTFTYDQLSTLADNGSVAITPHAYTSVAIADGFADNANKDYQMRGASKATFDINNDSNKDVIEMFDHRLELAMEENGWTYGITFGSTYIAKTGDIYNVDRVGFFASVTTSQLADSPASFNMIKKYGGTGVGYGEAFNVIMFKRSYVSGGPPYLSMQTKYMHSFSAGFFRFLGDTYLGAEKYEQGDFYAGDYDVYVKLGVGATRSSAKWWNGREWVDSEVMFRLSLGNKKPELFSRYRTGSGWDLAIEDVSIINTGTLYGYVFLDFYGSDNMPETDGQRAFNIGNFRIEYVKNNTVVKNQYPNSGWYDIVDKEIARKPYKSENDNAIFNEYNVESIFSSDDQSEPSFGIVLNADGSYLSAIPYAGTDAHPEQHFIDRVTSYWSASKRKIEANLLTHDGSAATNATNVTPGTMVEIDGTKLHPVAIDRKWRDDVMSLVCMEMVAEELPYDAEVEYLQSSGTQYIDTGLKVNFDSNIFVEQRARVAYNVTNVRQLNGTNGWAFWGCSSGNKFDSAAGTSTTTVGTSWHDVSLTYKKDNGKAHVTLYVDGVKIKEQTNGLIGNSNDYDLFIFAIGGVNAAAQLFSKEKIASCQILKDNVIVGDFIPVRAGQVGYLYDRVSGEMFGNAGTGAFIIGPDV